MHPATNRVQKIPVGSRTAPANCSILPKLQIAILPRFKSATHQTLHSLLQRCPSMKQLRQLHSQLITNGLLGEYLTLGRLIAFCSVSDAGDLDYGREVFERVPEPNRFMWNSLIRGYSNCDSPKEALFLHRRMLRSGLLPNHFTLPFVLKSCAKASAHVEALTVHAMIFKLGFESQIFVMNALLHAYSSCGSMSLARKVFDEIPYRNIVSWNSVIGGYSQLGDCEEAFALFREMRELGLEPDEFTLVSLLSACSQMVNLNLGRLVHHYIVVTGAHIDMILGNSLVDMYGKCGDLCVAQRCFDGMPVTNVITWTSIVCAHAKHGLIDDAGCWFSRMPERNIVSWNAMISCFFQNGLYHEGLDLYNQMQDLGVLADETTLVSVLSACSQNGNLVTGKKIHDYVCGNIANPSVTLFNSLVDMYAKCGHIDIALGLFGRMPEKNVVSWNVIIGALAMHGHAFDTVELFKCMVSKGFSPDGITFTGLLCACSHRGLLEVGQHYFEAMTDVYKVPREIEHYACMVDLLGRGGQLEKAVHLIKCMPMKPDVVIWGALLGACKIHGNVKIGKQVMKQLLELETNNGGLYVLISNMYYDVHQWEDMKNLRKLMKERGIKKDKATSLIEIDNNSYEFLVEDMRHERSRDIYFMLDQLTDHLMSVECLSMPSGAFFDVEEWEESLCVY
ncbi:pentatricopeptide repeat-containing protein At2g22410, mitochondrial-like [Elaeis guineensis]|uniref:Pentatricopeptide repeat-containing protein At2g22410, mitochondrial-like n=1 Tax=Elaeis guineensis var. tenera TaxID=51953 RepID=A0A6J0PK61_ELAGV|nr:pentatricopeptide repeat-containing protein At2g22410, mitochondrial-like [Elaeis guineensis]